MENSMFSSLSNNNSPSISPLLNNTSSETNYKSILFKGIIGFILLLLFICLILIYILRTSGIKGIPQSIRPYVLKILTYFGYTDNVIKHQVETKTKSILKPTQKSNNKIKQNDNPPNQVKFNEDTPTYQEHEELNNILKNTHPEQPQYPLPQNNEYIADDSNSNIQQMSGKLGFCYIGEDRGFRSCAPVGVNDMCMSGDIFPSMDVCVNPNLNA